jgi:hypothetical protein
MMARVEGQGDGQGEVLLKVCGRVNRCPIRRAPNFR